MKDRYPHPIIAREGWPFIIGGLLLSLVLTPCSGWLALPFWLFTLFALQFFRDPPRPVPQDADAILCPADGRIVVVERTTDPYRFTEALKISVFMNVFNVHSQRSPADGVLDRVEYYPGKFLNADLDKASEQNERNAVLMTTESGRKITFVQVAGLVARRILCYSRPGDKLRRGERYGFIRFGSRVDVYLPVDAVPQVAIGDKVSASSTILARLPLSETAAPETPAPSQSQAAQVVQPDSAPIQAAAAAPAAEAAKESAAATVGEAVQQPAAEALADAASEQQVIEEAADKVRAAAERETRS
ncbi:MAG: phosphatidylserine decarboxylase [Neisseria sp.]|uniref:phosphatidylserine decarboxylase n=1 Tax=Neisseria sp. TaxID=192066 RepID=UPI0026DA6F21|nr:phosphatidylserine decarboxylase [Neisseria sp.]MDO4249645.1 phosphatidylserine decarboxylase [Neisseria sp.]